MNNKYIKKMANFNTQIISFIAHGVCKVWAWGRSYSRDKNNFDYFIRTVRPTVAPIKRPYIQKVIYEDEYERSAKLKIGEVVIEYSFSKTPKENIQELFPTTGQDKVVSALIQMTQQTHYNNSVLELSKHRKENDGSKYRQSSS
tara:strand:+ start:207 stop:638 length:432 start_codon:yes stop_codon:yes gene_type:complete